MGVSVKGAGGGGLSSTDVTASSAQVLKGYTALTTDSNDEAKEGTIVSKAAATYNTSTTDQTIASNQYLSGAQTIKAVTTSGISAANIKAGVTVNVGDANDADRIIGVTGTFTNDATATAADMLNGTTAYVSGSKVTGTITSKAATTYTASTKDQTIAAGQYLSGAQTIKAVALNATASNMLKGTSASVTSNSTTVASVAGSIESKAAATYNTSTTDQTIASGQYLSGTQTIKAVTTSGISAANIKSGVTVNVGDANDADRIVGVTGTFTNDATAEAGEILSGKTAYVSGSKVTGTIPNKAAATYTASTSDQTISSGSYLSGDQTIKAVALNATASNMLAGTSASITSNDETITSVAGSIASKAAATYNTSTKDQTIAAGQYLSGIQTIKAVTTSGISAANIKSGVSVYVGDANDADRIVGVTGTFTNDATAEADEILSGKTAYVSGAKVTGTIPSKAETTYTASTSDQTISSGSYLSGDQVIKAVTLNATAGNMLAGTTASITSNDETVASVDGTIASKSAATYNTSTKDQTITAGQYLSGAQTIKAVTTSGISAANIKAGVTVNVGDTNDVDRIVGVTGTFTNDATAEAGDILSGITAYVGGSKVTGTMANKGAITSTITTQGGTYTIPAGYHNGSGVVTAQVGASTLTNAIISGEAYEESTGDYAWRSTVDVPAGYHNAQTLTKTFSEIFPAPETPATATEMLLGYQAYNKSGVLMTGTMANNGAVSKTISTQGSSYTIPAGYHNGSGTVTASISAGVITSGAGTATVSDPVYDSTNADFDLTVSGDVAAPTVGTAGYVSSTTGSKNKNTISGSKTLAKIVGKTTISGSTTLAPTLARTAKPSADTWTDAASGAATTTKPTSGVYVQIDAAANTGTLTATPSVTTAGYGTVAYHGLTNATATVGAAKATTAYIPITSGAINTPSGSKTQSIPTFDFNTSTGVLTATVAKTTGTAYRNVTTAGWLGTSTTGGTFTLGANSNTYTVGLASINTPAGSKAQSTPGMEFNTTTGIVTASVAATSGTAYANVTGAGYTGIATKSGTFSMTASSNTYNVGLGTTSKTDATASASVSKNPTASASATAKGFTAASSATSHYVTTSASAASGTATASVTASSASVTAGYTGGISTSTSAKSATSTEKTASNSATIYIPDGAINTPSGSATQSTPTFSFNASNGVVTASVAKTSGTAYRNVTSSGWLDASTTGGTFTMSASSNTYSIGLASINTPSGSATQSKPGMSFNTTTGIVTASVAATSGTAYANITGAGYIGTATKSGTFSMGANSNTYNVGLGTTSKTDATASASVSKNPSASASATAKGFTAASSATSHYVTTSASAASGVATASVTASSASVTAGYTGGVSTSTSAKSATSTEATASNSATIYIPDGAINTPSGSATQSKPTFSFNTSNGVLTASVAATSGTAYRNVTSSGWLDASTTGGNFTMSANSNTYSIGLATINDPSGSKAQSTPTFSFNASNGVVTASVAATTGTAYRNVTKAGYIGTSTTGGNFSMTASSNTYSIGLGAINAITGSATQSKPSFSFNASNGVITASVAETTLTAYANTKTAGYVPTATRSANLTMSANSNTYTVGLATINAPSGSQTQSKPGMTFDTTTGVVTASVAATSGTAYANVTSAGYTGAATKSGTFTLGANSNTYTVGIASINAPAGSATQSAPTFSFNTSNGVLTASVAATSGTAYANVTSAGYTGAATKSGTFSMTSNSNTYSIGLASINTPSGSAAQSKPTFSFDTTTGIVTASVAATSGTAYANITGAGYTGTATKSGTFSMTSNSNTYQIPVYDGSIT